METKETKKESGFSIIETLVAVTIASLVLAGFASSVVISLRGYRSGQLDYTATKIAQEGMELAINKRDNNIQCGPGLPDCPITDWQEGLTGDFEVDSHNMAALAAGGSWPAFNSSHYLCIEDDGRYGYCSDGTKLKGSFTREVNISNMDANHNKLKVKTTVTWLSASGATTSLMLEEILFGGN